MNKKNMTVIIGLGSSLGKRKETLNSACKDIKKIGNNFRISSYLETKPWGGVASKLFLNAVCSIETKLEPLELLDILQDIERKNGRERLKKWDDRTLDLDILYFGSLKINSSRLVIPHPKIGERDFVKKPLLELYPDFKI